LAAAAPVSGFHDGGSWRRQLFHARLYSTRMLSGIDAMKSIRPVLLALALAAAASPAARQASVVVATAPSAAERPRWQRLPDPPPLPRSDAEGYAKVNGARLYYAVFNAAGGRPVLLLHGGFDSSEDWGFEVPRLMRNHEVIVTDSRGRGRSSLPGQPITYALMASDTLGVLDALHIGKASIIGQSDGGIIGLLLAIHHPERVDKLFVFGANYSRSGDKDAPPDPKLAARYMAHAEAMYRRLSPTPDGFARMRRMMRKMYAVQPEIPTSDLAKISAPTIVADGDHEQFITRAHTESLAHLIPGARLVILKDTGHGGALQDPDGFHAAVASLLDPH
jgi:pimeloyl-ACP methyl ester carboxylesterase